MVRPSSCIDKGGILSPRRYLATNLLEVPCHEITHTFAVPVAATSVAQRRMGLKATRAQNNDGFRRPRWFPKDLAWQVRRMTARPQKRRQWEQTLVHQTRLREVGIT